MRTLAFVLLAGGLLAACKAENNVGFIVVQNQVPNAGCIIPAALGTTYRGSGHLDVGPLPNGAPNPGYLLTPAVRNGAALNQDNPNDNVIVLQGADIELVPGTTTASESLISTLSGLGLTQRTQFVSGAVQPESTAGMSFPVIDADQALAIANALGLNEEVTILARVTVFGEIDGAEIVSTPFNYPVTVCNGCGWESLGMCANVTNDTPVGEGGVCNPLQDGFLSCCTPSTGGIRCPASPEML